MSPAEDARGDWLKSMALRRPEVSAVSTEDEDLTYSELDARTEIFAAALSGAGMLPGSHLGLVASSTADAVAAIHASARLGTVLVPLDPRLPPTELKKRVEMADVSTLLTDIPDGMPFKGLDIPALRLGQLGQAAPAPFALLPPQGLHSIVFTSGTTGRPRGVMLTYENHAASAEACMQNIRTIPKNGWLTCVPLFHVGGLAVVLRSCLGGTTVVLRRRFDPAEVDRAIDGEGITLVSMVPAMLQRLLQQRRDRPFPPGLRGIFLGGDAAPPDLLATCRAKGVPILPTYGLTEASSQVACSSPDGTTPLGSAGRPLPPAEISIRGQGDESLGPREVGEIVVRGPMVMAGYYKDPQSTELALREGYLHTGDLGYLDEDCNLWVVGREDHRIVSGGEKLDPGEVEAVLGHHPGVAEVVVVGLRDPVWGHRVAAAVVLYGGHEVQAEELQAYCRQFLARFKVPKTIVFVKDIPRTPSGKASRAEVARFLTQGSPSGGQSSDSSKV